MGLTLIGVFGFLAIVHSNAQLDYRPGPPYSEAHSGHGRGPRVSMSQSANLPLVTPDILRTLTKAFGVGIPVYPPGPSRQLRAYQNSYASSTPTQIRYSQPPLVQPQSHNEYNHPHSQPSNAQTAHVYYSQEVQNPMSNVIVKFQQPQRQPLANFYNHDQPIQQYSQPDPVVHQNVQVVQYPANHLGQAPAQQFSQSQNKPQHYGPPPAFRQESQTKNKDPHEFSINLQFPPKKWQPRQNKAGGPPKKASLSSYYAYPVKTYRVKSHSGKSKPLHSEAFPVFTTIGRGLDGLNKVRRGVKKGTGKVVATGVKLGGKLAELGAGVMASVIKVASSI